MGIEWAATGRREARPLLLKVGVALFLSLAGFLYAHLRSRGDGRRPQQGGSGAGVEAGGETGDVREEESFYARSEAVSSHVRDGISVKEVASPAAGLSPGSKNFGDEGYLLPEFNELVLKELESFGLEADALEAASTNGLVQRKGERVSEEEIVAFKNLVKLLQERVASLEVQLLEFYGLREQQSTVRELENYLKVSTMEAKILSLKIESLQAENRRLGAQVSDYSRIKSELELAQSKIKHLEKRLQSEAMQAREKVTELQHRISALKPCRQDGEYRDEEDIGAAEKKFKHLEDEAAELRRENSKLAMENSNFAKKLSTKLLATSIVNSTEVNEVLDEVNRLSQINDQLTKEIAQLQIDRCADVEELVYLRWVNACLRYELRNYEPPPGKAVARDLSKSLSPKSEQKAKKLILEYANSGINEKNINLMDFFDSELCSSSQSSLTENGEVDNFSVDTSSATKKCGSSKTRFLKKLKKLVLGKDIHRDRVSSLDRSPTSCGTVERRASVSACSFDDMMDWSSYDSLASCITSDSGPGNHFMAIEGKAFEQQQNEAPWTRNLSRVSLDFRRLKSHEALGEMKGERSKSDVGTSYWQTVSMGEESLLRSSLSARLDHEKFDSSEKLNSSKGPNAKPKRRTRSASLI